MISELRVNQTLVQSKAVFMFLFISHFFELDEHFIYGRKNFFSLI